MDGSGSCAPAAVAAVGSAPAAVDSRPWGAGLVALYGRDVVADVGATEPAEVEAIVPDDPAAADAVRFARRVRNRANSCNLRPLCVTPCCRQSWTKVVLYALSRLTVSRSGARLAMIYSASIPSANIPSGATGIVTAEIAG